MDKQSPNVVVVAGPNGSGKSTAAPVLLRDYLGITEMAIVRVASRVQQGGHSVPNEIVIRRYHAGLRNLFQLYMPIVDAWMMFDNSPRDGYELIASGRDDAKIAVANESIWKLVQEKYS